MRKLFSISTLAAFALAATVTTANAQEKTMGIVGGINWSQLAGNDWDSYGTSQAKSGFIGGIFVAFPVGDGNVAIEPEVLYVNKGGKAEFGSVTTSVTSTYLQIPLFIKWSSQPDGSGVYVFGGPGVSFSLSCNAKQEGNVVAAEDYDGSCESSEANAKGNTVVSGTLGLGFSKGRAGIEGRYGFDWGDAYKHATTDTNYDISNSVWSILIRITK